MTLWTMNGWKKLFAAPAAKFLVATDKGDFRVVKALLKRNPGLVLSEDLCGMTPLHLAVQRGYKDMVKLLLANGADVNANKGHKELVKMMTNKTFMNSKGMFSGTPLHAAAQNGSKEMTELLLAHKAEVNAHDFFGYTPLHLAARDGRKEVAELLLANNAEINAKGGFNGSTPLHLAVLSGSKELVELLLARKVKVDVMDNQGKTPLRLAEENGYKEVAEMLPRQGGSSLRCPVCKGSGLEWRSALHGGGYIKCRFC